MQWSKKEVRPLQARPRRDPGRLDGDPWAIEMGGQGRVKSVDMALQMPFPPIFSETASIRLNANIRHLKTQPLQDQ